MMSERMARLCEILDTMEVPELRRHDLHWLRRNLGIRNRLHPDFCEAIRILADLARVDI
jgi:hypothetical protein